MANLATVVFMAGAEASTDPLGGSTTKEYFEGRIVHTRVPHPRRPVEEYLAAQGRYRHLFQPVQNDVALREIQNHVDEYWRKAGLPGGASPS